MRSKSFMAVAGSLVVLLVLAGGVVAYDSGRKDTIAKGITSLAELLLGENDKAAKAEKAKRGLFGRKKR